jgi:regulator of nucleoside diphosphate kinase
MLMEWLSDERVTCYLSDGPEVSRSIVQVLDRTQMPILTQLFNRDGRFFLIYDRTDTPVGFVRLVTTGGDYEIVLVIGNRDNWGRGLGSSAIREALKLAFLQLRAQTVIAKIQLGNLRSMSAFERCGFVVDTAAPTLKSLSITGGRYRRLLREGVMSEAGDIYVTELDQGRLRELIDLNVGAAHADLEHEIERAILVSSERVAGDVVTMNSKVALRIDDEETEISLVYPKDSNDGARKISVLSPIGAAILGYREGHIVDQVVSDRTRRILIDRVTHQPEARGYLHL